MLSTGWMINTVCLIWLKATQSSYTDAYCLCDSLPIKILNSGLQVWLKWQSVCCLAVSSNPNSEKEAWTPPTLTTLYKCWRINYFHAISLGEDTWTIACTSAFLDLSCSFPFLTFNQYYFIIINISRCMSVFPSLFEFWATEPWCGLRESWHSWYQK
jgi:hypothetical protein